MVKLLGSFTFEQLPTLSVCPSSTTQSSHNLIWTRCPGQNLGGLGILSPDDFQRALPPGLLLRALWCPFFWSGVRCVPLSLAIKISVSVVCNSFFAGGSYKYINRGCIVLKEFGVILHKWSFYGNSNDLGCVSMVLLNNKTLKCKVWPGL